MAALTFQLQNTATGTGARAGVMQTDHGDILTPIFMPVGTVGTVKAVTQQQLSLEVQAQIILIFNHQDLSFKLNFFLYKIFYYSKFSYIFK